MVLGMWDTTVRAYVRVQPEIGPGCIYFVGGDAPKVEESRERAALKAVRHLIKWYGVRIDDFTSDKVDMCRISGRFFAQKRGVLSPATQNLLDPLTRDLLYGKPLNDVVHVSMNYVAFLSVVAKVTSVVVFSFKTVTVDSEGFIAWIMVSCPQAGGNLEMFFSDPCVEMVTAEQKAAKKAMCYLAHWFHLEIIDANYGGAVLQHTAALMWRERCLCARTSFLVARTVDSHMMGEAESGCSTPTDECSRISTPVVPPALPVRRKCFAWIMFFECSFLMYCGTCG